MSQQNFTPLNIKQTPVKPKQGKIGTIILIIAIITALIIAFILILLIQKKNQMSEEENFIQNQPTVMITPTEIPEITPVSTQESQITITIEPTQEEATTPSQILPTQ